MSKMKNKKLDTSEEVKYFSFNMDKFREGKVNYILITGFSGSGKSVLAEKFAQKYEMIHIQLDLIDPYSIKELEIIGFNESTEVFYDFLEDNPEFDKIFRSYKNSSNEDVEKIFNKFIPYVLKWCANHPDNSYVIEGIQIYEYPDKIKKDLPIIIMNTSAEKSMERRARRDGEDFDKSIISKENISKLNMFKQEVLNTPKKSTNKIKRNNDSISQDIGREYTRLSFNNGTNIDKIMSEYLKTLRSNQIEHYLTSKNIYTDPIYNEKWFNDFIEYYEERFNKKFIK